jgi:hypothetical protein
MTVADTELDVWRRQWQAGSAGPDNDPLAAELRERVARQSRRNRLGLIAPVHVTVLIGGGVIQHALSTGQAMDIAIAAECWLFIAVTWAAAIWTARGTWRPLGETTAAFLDLSIRRCQANMRAISLAIGLYIGQFAIMTLMIGSYSGLSPDAVLGSWPTTVLGGVVFPVLLLGGFWFRRRQRAELERLQRLQQELTREN